MSNRNKSSFLLRLFERNEMNLYEVWTERGTYEYEAENADEALDKYYDEHNGSGSYEVMVELMEENL